MTFRVLFLFLALLISSLFADARFLHSRDTASSDTMALKSTRNLLVVPQGGVELKKYQVDHGGVTGENMDEYNDRPGAVEDPEQVEWGNEDAREEDIQEGVEEEDKEEIDEDVEEAGEERQVDAEYEV
mmetsp:Transcript_13337/g.31566  ORF Transcript_13337/g.31566 Transcript_13337/m.31566 type:complete len:128 (-) Transcript_13337:636-1019(-)